MARTNTQTVCRDDKSWDHIEENFKAYRVGAHQSVKVVYEFLEKKVNSRLRAKGLKTEDVSEVCQDVLIKVHRFRDQYNTTKPLRAWVYTITDRTVIDFWRRSGRYTMTALDESFLEAGQHSNPENHLENQQALQKIDRKLQELKPIDKIIVDMVVHESMSMKEVAAKTGLSTLAVKMRLFRLRQVLRVLLVLMFVVGL